MDQVIVEAWDRLLRSFRNRGPHTVRDVVWAVLACAWWITIWLIPWLAVGDIWLLVWVWPNIIGAETARACGISPYSPQGVVVATIIVGCLVGITLASLRIGIRNWRSQ